MDRSPPGSTGHGILQARILEWVAILFSGDLPNPRTKPRSSAMQEMQEMRVLSLSQEALLEKGMATHSSGWSPSHGRRSLAGQLQRVGHDWLTEHTHTYTHSHTHMHTYIHTHAQIDTHTCTNRYTHMHTCAHTHIKLLSSPTRLFWHRVRLLRKATTAKQTTQLWVRRLG